MARSTEHCRFSVGYMLVRRRCVRSEKYELDRMLLRGMCVPNSCCEWLTDLGCVDLQAKPGEMQ